MRSKTRVLAAAIAAVIVLAAPAQVAGQPRPFALDAVTAPGTDGDELTVTVSTSGTPLDRQELESTSNWRLGMVTDESTPIKLDRVEWRAGSKTALLVFSRAATSGADLSTVGWLVVFTGSQVLTASVDVAPRGRFIAANAKDDASLYAFGSVLVGPSTKPIYVIDLKADYSDEIKTSGWLWHVAAAANTNTDAAPPVDKVRIDPDSITTLFSLSKRHKVRRSPWLNAYMLTFAPIQGEFERADAVADAVTAGQVQLDLKPIGRFTVYPTAGYEVGHAIRRPTQIADQDVDLSNWNRIVRGVLGITGKWTLFKAEPTDDDWYIVTVSASYTTRFLAADEPFSKPGVVDGERAVVTTVNKDARHHAEAELDWNLMRYTSVSLKYQYGAVAPLFQLVDHQVALGITLKAAQK